MIQDIACIFSLRSPASLLRSKEIASRLVRASRESSILTSYVIRRFSNRDTVNILLVEADVKCKRDAAVTTSSQNEFVDVKDYSSKYGCHQSYEEKQSEPKFQSYFRPT